MKLPTNWESIEFGDAFEYQPRTGIKAGEGASEGKYKFFTSSSEQTKRIDRFSFDGEHLIFSTGGKSGIHYCNEKFSTSNDCFVVKTNRKDICLKFVYYFFIGNMPMLERGFRGAGLKHLSSKYLGSIKIPKPPYGTQKKIAVLLEKMEMLRECRADADKLTDELLRSVFFEMFGDMRKNSKKWATFSFSEIVDEFRYGTSNKSSIDGYPALRIPNIIKGDVELSDLKNVMVTEKEFAKLKLEDGDVLFVRTNGNPDYVGRCAVIRGLKNFIFASYLIRARPDSKKVNSTFLQYYLQSSFGKSQLKSKARTSAGQYNINTEGLGGMAVHLPPIELQNKYAKIVAQLDQIREQQNNSKQSIDDLFNVLMQKAFRGELVV